jgi:hypothetical protein
LASKSCGPQTIALQGITPEYRQILRFALAGNMAFCTQTALLRLLEILSVVWTGLARQENLRRMSKLKGTRGQS